MRHLPILLLAALQPLLADDQSDFSSAPDGTWKRFDPRAEVSLSPAAVFDFSNNQCRLIAPQPTTIEEYNAAQGLARAGLFAPTEFSDAVASVDITDWSPTTLTRYSEPFVDGVFIGVFTRTQTPIMRGSVTGYSASILDMGDNSGPGGVGRRARFQLFRVFNDGAAYFPISNGPVDFLIDPTHDYRLILVSRGHSHTARVFDLSEPSAPVAEIIGFDSNYPTGRSGLMILTDRQPYVLDSVAYHTSIEATFDNFLAWDGTPPPLVIEHGIEPGTLALSCDFQRALATDLESTTDFTDPLTPWQPATPTATTVAGNQLVTIFPIDGPKRFFRRKSL